MKKLLLTAIFMFSGSAFSYQSATGNITKIMPRSDGTTWVYISSTKCVKSGGYYLLPSNHENKKEIYSLILSAATASKQVALTGKTCDPGSTSAEIVRAYVEYP